MQLLRNFFWKLIKKNLLCVDASQNAIFETYKNPIIEFLLC
jgi:hypothetical protein